MAISTPNLAVISVTLFFLVSRVTGDCTCSEEDIAGDPKSVTTPYKIGAFFAILIASAAGVAIPLMGKSVKALRAEGEMFFLIKAFAAGVILATGFVHILPDAFEQLTNPCLTNPVWENFPFTGFIAMVAAMLTLMVESTATGYYRRKHFKGEGQAVDDEEHAGHVHIHGVGAMAAASEDRSKLELIRHRVTTQVLELGIVVHSVIIGIAVGASQSLDTVKTLMAALCFHQFFEGMGLGSCIHQAKFKWSALFTMALFFALTTPLGIAIGIGVTSTYKEDSPNALIVQGTLDSAAAGILIYMALVDLLAADFMNPKMQRNPRLMLGANLSLLLGAGCMSLIAKWA